MRAAYTSPFVAALIEEGIDVGWVGGISAGTSLLSNYTSRDVWRTKHSFTDFAADPQFGSWRTFVRGRGMFHAEYIYEQAGLPGGAIAFDWDAYAAHPAEVSIGAFCASRGEQVEWSRADMPTLRDFMVRVRASSTMPLVMPPVVLDSEVYLDGALGPGAGIPLAAAQAAGYRRFIVVLTQTRAYRKGPATGLPVIRRHFRRYPAVAEAMLARPERYNAVREEIFDLESDGAAFVFAPDSMPVGNSTRSLPALHAAWALGAAQTRREMPRLREWLGA